MAASRPQSTKYSLRAHIHPSTWSEPVAATDRSPIGHCRVRVRPGACGQAVVLGPGQRAYAECLLLKIRVRAQTCDRTGASFRATQCNDGLSKCGFDVIPLFAGSIRRFRNRRVDDSVRIAERTASADAMCNVPRMLPRRSRAVPRGSVIEAGDEFSACTASSSMRLQ